MRRPLATVSALLAIAAAAALAPAPAEALSEDELHARIAAVLDRGPASVGALVRDLDSGEVLYERRAGTARVPASLQKLFVTSAALLRMGPDERLRTRAVAAPDAPLDADGTLRGDLVLVGGGDPFFGERSAGVLVGELRATGLRRVAGAVVGDDSAFDARRSGCCRGYDHDLGGVLSALAYGRGIASGRARLDAARYAAGRVAALLRRAGVRAARPSRAGRAGDGARTLASAESPTIAGIARLVNVPSNNFAAEMLLKALGLRERGRGSTAGGAAAVRDALARLGVRARIVDGSGLSRRNRASPRDVVRLLERLHRDDAVGESFRESLALTAASGTVRRRLRGTPAARRCRVKTGTLRGVSALAGYCRTRGGREIAFALMAERVDVRLAKRREDRVVTAIADLERGGRRAPERAPAPATPGAPDSGGAVPAP